MNGRGVAGPDPWPEQGQETEWGRHSDADGAPGAGPSTGQRNGAAVGRRKHVRDGIRQMQEVTYSTPCCDLTTSLVTCASPTPSPLRSQGGLVCREGLCTCDQVKARSSWIRVGPKAMDWSPYKGGHVKQARARTRRPRDDRGRNGSMGSPQRTADAGRVAGGRPSLETSVGAQHGQLRMAGDRGLLSSATCPASAGTALRTQRACPELVQGSHDLSRPSCPPHQESNKTNPTSDTKNRLWDDKQEFQDDTSRTSRGQNVDPGLPW